MSNKDDLIREVLQISKEYEEADQSAIRAFLIIGGCWISSLILILVGDISLQSKWGPIYSHLCFGWGSLPPI
jgi:hypothetical protein